jgi:glutathione S-transferase
MALTLYVGNRNYSSWSLRGSLAVAASGLDYQEVVLPMREDDFYTRIAELSPARRVPVLHHDDRVIWDSLVIAEYVAELAPEANLWPADAADRALARSISAEMHSGFLALRRDMSMNLRKHRPGVGHTDEALAEARRVMDIWRACLDRSGGPLLFGAFTIADAMYAPIVTRFQTYAVDLDDTSAAYMNAVLDHPAMRRWTDAAHAEPWVIEQYE